MTDPPETLFTHANLLTDYFGRWPSFHDAEVLAVQLLRENIVLSLDIYVFTTSSEVDARGHFKIEKEAIVRLICRGLGEVQLQDLNHQNVLSELVAGKNEDGSIRVELAGIFGLTGALSCLEAEVAEVRPGRPNSLS